jgi:hypothetical protein
MERESIRHESFGQIQFNRTSSKDVHFYGSELPQDHYISLEIHESEIQRELTQDRHYNRGQIIRLRLSSGQFAELITSMNHGSGVPCTIERIQGKKIAELPEVESRKDFVHRKFEDRMKMFADEIRGRQVKALELVKKKALSKADMYELQTLLNWMTMEIERNIPFFAKCFQETMDEVVFEAKTEVENAIQHKISVLGLNALHEQQKLLES